MEQIKSFKELTEFLNSQTGSRKKIAVANAVDMHSIEAVVNAVNKGVVEAYLVGDAKVINEHLKEFGANDMVHVVDVPEVQAAVEEAIRMVKQGECDILMKGFVNTDVILKAILNKEKGLLLRDVCSRLIRLSISRRIINCCSLQTLP